MAAAPAAAQTTHVVRLIADAGKDDYRFEPAELTVRPNDVIVFRVASGAPHSIVFEGGGALSPGVRGAFNGAMPGRSGDLSSPLLTAIGSGVPDGGAAGAGRDLPVLLPAPPGVRHAGTSSRSSSLNRYYQ